MPNRNETKVQLSLDDETICKINILSMGLNVSMGNAIRFMIKHYLKFGVNSVKANRLELEDRDNSEKDNLIEILKTNITGKEMAINQLASDLVSISKKLNNANKILGGVEDLILCSER